MVCCIGTLATRSCEPRQARKGAAAAADSGAGMLLVQCAALTIPSMTYQVLARKWRPQHFRDMIGQDHVVKALSHALDSNRLHHAYLFTGMRGVGKTTVARVLAKSLNCETQGVSAEPCGTCASCQDIESGRFFDLIEVDAASRTKVEETRELLENVPYAPSSGRFKVYLIDEVHMFTTHSFNALLKTLEEPPEHVKFVLATTDPQKVPVTVLSRCLQFNLKAIPEQLLRDHLVKILDTEGIAWDEAALVHIARASEGSVRDALSLVEQAAALGNGAVSASEVESMLGRLSPERVYDLLDAVAEHNAQRVLHEIEALAQFAPDYAQLLNDMLSVLHQVALYQTLNQHSHDAGLHNDRTEALASNMDVEDVQLFYQIGVHGRRDMPFAPDQRAALEMTVLRMLAFRPAELDTEQQSGEVNSDVAGTAQLPKQPELTQQLQQDDKPKNAEVVQRPAETAAAITTDAPTNSEKPRQQQADAAAAQVLSVDWQAENWCEIVPQLGLVGMPLQLASNSSFDSLVGDTLTLQLSHEHEHLHTPRFSERVQSAISSARASATTLVINMVTEELDTPVSRALQREEDALQHAQEAIRQDPLVKTLLEKVDGKVDEGSVKPVDTSNSSI